MTTRGDEIAARAAVMARTFGIKNQIANGHTLFSLVDNDICNRMAIAYTTDGYLSIRIGGHQAFCYWAESDLNEVYNGLGEELERRLGLTAQEVAI